jgi:hypothetical protein
MTGARAVDVNAWIRRKTDGWLDLQGGNLLFGAEFALMFLSLSVLSIGFLGFGLMFALGPDSLGRWDWESPLIMLVGNLLISLPWGLYMHFLGNKAVKETPPVRFNLQRRQVAIPRWTEGKEFKLPFWTDNAAGIAYIVIAFTIAAVLYTPIGLENNPVEYVQRVRNYLLTALVIEVLVVGTYLFFALRLKKKHDPRLVYEIYPWEKLVAYIETRQDIGPGLMATHTVLTMAIPKPDDPESALAAASINVGHETAGLAQWECIRQFMENGPLQSQMPPGPQRNVLVTLARQESGRLVLPAIPGSYHHRTPDQDPGPQEPARGTESLVRAFAQGTMGQTICGTAEPESTACRCLRAWPEVRPDGASV